MEIYRSRHSGHSNRRRPLQSQQAERWLQGNATAHDKEGTTTYGLSRKGEESRYDDIEKVHDANRIYKRDERMKMIT